MYEIPIQDHPAFSEEVELDGTPYIFTFLWNTREAAWYLDISDTDETVIIAGIKLVVNHELIRFYGKGALPPGALVVYDTEKDPGEKITRDGLGSRFKVYYLTEDEYNAL